MTELVTIAVFNYPQEIVVLKSILVNKGIFHYFENETLISIDPFASFAYGGIKLKIKPEDTSTVQSILDDLNNHLKIVE